ALLHADPIASALLERSAALEQAGFHAAVHVRSASPLSFFHPEGPEGPRYRLETSGAGYSEVGGARVHTQAQLLAALERDPLCFSTSALLRPILQDTLLPTVAYVGGPGELAYFAQLAPLYRLFDRPMPLVVPRARFRVISTEVRALLRELAIEADDAALPLDELLARCVQPEGSAPSSEEIARRLLGPFHAAMAELEPTFAPSADAMSTPIRKTRSTVERAIRKLAGKYEAAQRRSQYPRVDEARRVQQFLYPDGAPQERVHGFAWYASRFGERAFLDCVLGAVRPFDGASRDLEP
ncbi:MAG: bacillithiol biosynthesis BshC, partial [Myxococcaceae bacterium]